MPDEYKDDLTFSLNSAYFDIEQKQEVGTQDEVEKKEEPKPDENAPSLFEEEMRLLSMTKTDILNMILELSDNGFIREQGAILNGKIPYEIRSTTVKQGMRMSELFEEKGLKTQVAATDFFSLHVLAGFLYSYNGTVLPDKLDDRAEWVKENLSGIVFKALKNRAVIFSRKTDLLTYEEVEDFL